MKIKQVIQYLIIVAIGAFFLYYVFKGIQWHELKQKLNEANYYWIALGMSIGILSHLLRAWRANMLYAPMGYRVRLSESFYAVMIGYMVNYIIPRAGEVSRCAALNRTNDIPLQKSLGTVITERLVDMLLLLTILGFVFVLHFGVVYDYIQQSSMGSSAQQSSGVSLKMILSLSAIVGASALFFARKKLVSIPLFQKLIQFAKGFTEGLTSIRHVSQPVVFVLLSISIWLCYILMMYFCLFAMPATASLTFMDTLVVFAIGTIGMVIPAPAAGAGTYHFAVMQSLLLFGVAEHDGIAYATIVHGVQMIVLVVIGALCSIPVFLSRKNQNI